MTKAEYADYERRYAEGTKGFEIVAPTYPTAEPYFSWTPCGICGTYLGGDRYDMTLTNPGPGWDKGNDVEVPACADCFYYSENGQLDDMTMMEMEG